MSESPKRKAWFANFSFKGSIMKHPDGPEQPEKTNRELAKAILERFETGAVLELPNTKDEHGHHEWEWIEPPGHTEKP